ncbi:hypothetical protein [Kribbella pittospori]|uniref:hypothetical protein n=1 Tax=Kribbella pittospori TaxID=722689 RepID=UPI001EDEF30F|nr:hypothetical protein [Kribbella pittospori]
MNRRKLLGGLSALIGTGLLAAALVPAQASATPTPSAVAGGCLLQLGSITAGGDHNVNWISSAPPASALVSQGPKDLFPDGQAWLAGSLAYQDYTGDTVRRTGYVVIGQELFATSYFATSGKLIQELEKTKIGGGWYQNGPRYLEESRYSGSTTGHTYSLYGDTLNRWNVNAGTWSAHATYAGFGAVKTMALISQTATYDTFLANMTGGSLYTIRVPKTGAPVVKLVRSSTWQGFETLVAEKCGTQSTLLLGIDKDTQSGYLYAVSHATGTSTVIKGLGKVPTTFADPTYFRYHPEEGGGDLFGE